MTPDGFMNNGEPVIRLQYTNGQSGNMVVEILQYVVNTTPGANYVPGKGNPMTNPDPLAYGGAGYNRADGYNMVGSVASVTLPPAGTGAIFAGKETEAGFGVEFAGPYTYLKNYFTNSAAQPKSYCAFEIPKKINVKTINVEKYFMTTPKNC